MDCLASLHSLWILGGRLLDFIRFFAHLRPTDPQDTTIKFLFFLYLLMISLPLRNNYRIYGFLIMLTLKITYFMLIS